MLLYFLPWKFKLCSILLGHFNKHKPLAILPWEENYDKNFRKIIYIICFAIRICIIYVKRNCLTMDSMVQKLSNLEQVIKSVPVSNVKAFLKQINNSDEINWSIHIPTSAINFRPVVLKLMSNVVIVCNLLLSHFVRQILSTSFLWTVTITCS